MKWSAFLVGLLTGSAAACLAALALPASAQETPAPAPLAGDADAGAEIYGTECRGCHAVSIAPTLRGLIGRPVASVAGFGGYSDALKAKSDQTWSEAAVNTFLTAPQEFAPGTLMVKAIPDPQQRADIIAYIASLPPPRQ
ncbi:MAG: c-type cytochrome [Hyphomonadaceae bacterium]